MSKPRAKENNEDDTLQIVRKSSVISQMGSRHSGLRRSSRGVVNSPKVGISGEKQNLMLLSREQFKVYLN